ncbi:MAG: hypothetical protein R3E12_00130 [Candidatus Eisenbacteria bacterium]|uniref:Uncharacterized protein n=1 Tax=Eiseniibacteriota bacterium TaxID=2212470 RepID=A0A956RPG6_UNCEI|nr:hypothetical protein [Candidatus Eisenbacteria bacterium]
MSNINPVGQNYDFRQIQSTTTSSHQSGWSKFGRILGDVAGGVMGNVPVLGSALSSLNTQGDASFNQQYELILLQQQIQQNMQMFSTMSNISKSKHEAAMTAIRNMK